MESLTIVTKLIKYNKNTIVTNIENIDEDKKTTSPYDPHTMSCSHNIMI